MKIIPQVESDWKLAPAFSRGPLPPRGAPLTKSLHRQAESRSKIYSSRGTERLGKEVVMLDLAFVGLGFAVIAVTALYAVALRQL